MNGHKTIKIKEDLLQVALKKLLPHLVELGIDFGDNFFLIKDFTINNEIIVTIEIDKDLKSHVNIKRLANYHLSGFEHFQYENGSQFILEENENVFFDSLGFKHENNLAILSNYMRSLKMLILFCEKIKEQIDSYELILKKHQEIILYSKKITREYKKIILIEKVKSTKELTRDELEKMHFFISIKIKNSIIADVDFEEKYLKQLNSNSKNNFKSKRLI